MGPGRGREPADRRSMARRSRRDRCGVDWVLTAAPGCRRTRARGARRRGAVRPGSGSARRPPPPRAGPPDSRVTSGPRTPGTVRTIETQSRQDGGPLLGFGHARPRDDHRLLRTRRLPDHRTEARRRRVDRRARGPLHGCRSRRPCASAPAGAWTGDGLPLPRGARRAGRDRTIDLPTREHAYVVCEPLHHHHVVCSRCGRVADIADEGLRTVVNEVARRTGYRVDEHRLELFGLCPGCQAAEPAPLRHSA